MKKEGISPSKKESKGRSTKKLAIHGWLKTRNYWKDIEPGGEMYEIEDDGWGLLNKEDTVGVEIVVDLLEWLVAVVVDPRVGVEIVDEWRVGVEIIEDKESISSLSDVDVRLARSDARALLGGRACLCVDA